MPTAGAPPSAGLVTPALVTTPAAAAFTRWLAALRPDVEAALEALLPTAGDWPGALHEAMRYSVQAGGKRVRPALAVLAGEALGAPRAALLPPGAALELIHTYSLIHDDLPALDDDDLRRGRPTLHKRFDEATAILAGDALLTLGLTVLAREPRDAAAEARRRAVELVGTAIGTGGMIGGQVEDLAVEAAWPDDPRAALERIHRGKTGALLTAALRLGGVHAGADAAADARLAALGERLGLMFQIADDILDVEGSAEQLGKTAGKDAAARKLTFPALYGLDDSRARLQRLREEALAIAAALPGDVELWAGLVEYLAGRTA
jgi:geranylgeranyl diphosphate synthase type II